MGIFGDTPIDEVPTEIPDGTYRVIVKKVDVRENKQPGDFRDKVIVTWLITEGDFEGDELKQWLIYYPRLTEDIRNAFDAEQSKNYRNDARRITRFLSDMGIPAEEWNEIDFTTRLKAIEAYVDIVTNQKGFTMFNRITLDTADESGDEGLDL